MKSKVNKEFVSKPADFFKIASTDFLESERIRTVAERDLTEKPIQKVKQTENESQKKEKKQKNGAKEESNEVLMKVSHDFLQNEKDYATKEKINQNGVSIYQVNGKQIEQNIEKSCTVSQTQERYVFSAGSLKRYVSTCYFEPKQVPVSYSETVIITIGSPKKEYYESVYCENKLIPNRWSESMHTRIKHVAPFSEKSEVNIKIEEPQFHYISLEPQQKIAQLNSIA